MFFDFFFYIHPREVLIMKFFDGAKVRRDVLEVEKGQLSFLQ